MTSFVIFVLLHVCPRDSKGMLVFFWLRHLLSPRRLRIYFYWICRGQEEFDWFCDLLSDAAEGPAAGIVDITLFLTGEIELSQARFRQKPKSQSSITAFAM